MIPKQTLPSHWSNRLAALRAQIAVLDDKVAVLDEAALLRSWVRCADAGVDRLRAVHLPKAERGALLRPREQAVVARAVELLGTSIDAVGAVAIATDIAGTVVHSAGRAEGLPARWRGLLEAGTSMAEPVLGTTAPTLAAIEHRPQTVIREAHFWHPMEAFYCTAVPLPDPRGGWLGALDISGYEALPDIDALGLLRLAAARIEDELLRKLAEAGVMELMPPVAAGSVGRAGLLAVDADGQVTGLNSVARRWLRADLARCLPVPLTLLLGSDVGHVQRSPRRHTVRPVELRMPTGWLALMHYGPPGAAGAQGAVTPVIEPEPESGKSAAAGSPATLASTRLQAVREALAACNGNVSETARRLGVSRNSIYRWLAPTAALRRPDTARGFSWATGGATVGASLDCARNVAQEERRWRVANSGTKE